MHRFPVLTAECVAAIAPARIHVARSEGVFPPAVCRRPVWKALLRPELTAGEVSALDCLHFQGLLAQFTPLFLQRLCEENPLGPCGPGARPEWELGGLGLLLGAQPGAEEAQHWSLFSVPHPGREITGEHPSDSPPWEEELVSKIRAMSALEKTLALEAISHCIQRHSQVGRQTLMSTEERLPPPPSAAPGLARG